MRPTGTPEDFERTTPACVESLRQGTMPGEVAKLVGVDRRSVCRWRATLREDGERALLARRPSGRPQKLLAKDKRKLEGLLLKAPLDAGFGTDLWACPACDRTDRAAVRSAVPRRPYRATAASSGLEPAEANAPGD